MQIVRVAGQLPPGFADLSVAAESEGVRNMRLLAEAWASGAQRFDKDGAALFAAEAGGRLAGVGGVKREEGANEPAMRMHRFYVHPAYRRLGVGKRIAEAAMAHGLRHASLLTCNARASEAAGPFWISLGFVPVLAAGYTHVYRRGSGP